MVARCVLCCQDTLRRCSAGGERVVHAQLLFNAGSSAQTVSASKCGSGWRKRACEQPPRALRHEACALLPTAEVL
jgi:hypothetical protein